MKKLIFLFGLAVFISEIATAQKELNNWFFGNNAGLSFNSGAPVFKAGSAMIAPAGCSSISDNLGNLLFYTNGQTVWNKNHQPMPNGTGLKGDPASTQGVLITYYPGNNNLYYIFTVDKAGGANGLQSSIVNMSLDGGLGDLDPTEKNNYFYLPVSEKVTAVKQKNGIDLWLIVHQYNSDAFVTYSIDCKGILAYPRFQNAGSFINTPGNTGGYMKVSPDGKKLVSANFAGDFEIFDFDNVTGDITNARVLPSSSNTTCGPYGVEFSPDSKLLYVSEVYSCTIPLYTILQYRLDPDINNTIASKTFLDAGGGNLAGALQIGPDNKIYIAYDGAANLGVISNPNVYGTGCGFVKAGISIAPATSTFGLPNAIAGFKRNTLGADTTVCNGVPLILKLGLQSTTYLWNDGTVADSLIVTQSGTYWVDLISTNANGVNCPITDTINITFQPSPKFSLGNDTLICQDRLPLTLAPALPPGAYLWQDSTTKASYPATDKGIYWLQVTANGCSARDSVLISTTTGTPFNLGADTSFCIGDSLRLTAGSTATNYLWNTGSTTNTITIKAPGIYWCEAKNTSGCSYRDSIKISSKALPVFSLGKDTILCPNKFPLLLNQNISGATYLWQDSSTANSFSVPGTGTYSLRVTVNGCSSKDTIIVKENPVTSFSLGTDTVVCTGTPFVLTVSPAFTTYLWNTGSTSKSITITNSGWYWCEATNSSGCSYKDSIQVTLKLPPVIDLGRDTTVCQNRFPYLLNQTIPGASYLWQDGSTSNSFSAVTAGTYWLQATVNGCSSRDSISIKSNPVSPFTLGADTILCAGNPLVLSVTPAFSSYLWSTGSTSKSISVTAGGTYWCEAINNTGCAYRDSINVTFKPSPVVNLGNDTAVCVNAFPLVIGKPIAGATFLWQDGSANALYSVMRPGLYSVQATVNGCSSRDSISIAANTVNSFSLGADTTLCSPAPFTLKANIAASNYLWSTGSTAQSITINASGKYWCEINRGTGCSFSDTIQVVFAAPIAFTLGRDTVICDNKTLLLDVTNTGGTYTWQDNSNKPQFQVSKSGTYYVAVTKGACISSDTIVVTYSARTQPDLGVDKTICPGEEILLDANVPASAYLWQDGSTGRTYKITLPGIYSVQVTNECGKYSDEIIISLGSCMLMIPNAFTPDRNPNNIFRVLRASELKNFNFQVFSRWGQQVFQTNKPSEGWDGRYNGVGQPAGTYVYVVSYTDAATGKKDSQKGTVILVR